VDEEEEEEEEEERRWLRHGRVRQALIRSEKKRIS
jgi:hypothetical protein